MLHYMYVLTMALSGLCIVTDMLNSPSHPDNDVRCVDVCVCVCVCVCCVLCVITVVLYRKSAWVHFSTEFSVPVGLTIDFWRTKKLKNRFC